MGLNNWLINKMTDWLIYEEHLDGSALCDFDRLSFEIRPCDVILIEGRSRVSHIIKNITQSPWTHSALYIGRIHELENEEDREIINKYYNGDPSDQLIVEALLGEGTIIVPLKKYNKDHVRICRPKGLTRQDSTNVLSHALKHVGGDYNVRQLFDLARLLFPYSILPRRWRSSLFERVKTGETTQTVCSSMIASAFNSVHFPILPVVHQNSDGSLRMFKRNTQLYIPPDFDYSPYFEIIKYAIMGFDDLAIYRQLPWDKNGVICNDENDCYIPTPPVEETIETKAETQAVLKNNGSTLDNNKTAETNDVVDGMFENNNSDAGDDNSSSNKQSTNVDQPVALTATNNATNNATNASTNTTTNDNQPDDKAELPANGEIAVNTTEKK